MFRQLRAFAWLRWKILSNGLTKRNRRDALETLSGIGAVLGTLLVVLLVLPMAIGLAMGAFFGGRFIPSDADAQEGVLAVSRVLLLLLTVAIVLAPVIRSGTGQALNLGRLLMLPIRKSTLHVTETVAALSDPWILLVIPALLFLPLGLLSTGETAAALGMLAAGALFVLVLALLGALISFGSALLFRKRRRGEFISLIVFSALTCAAFVPTLIATYVEETEEGAGRSVAGRRLEERMPQLVRTFPVYGQVLPSEQYARALYLCSEGDVPRASVPLAALAVSATVLYSLSMATYRRLLDQPEVASARRGGEIGSVRTFRIPGFSPAAAAAAAVQLRTASRTIRMKSALFLTPVILLLLYLLLTRRLDLKPPAWLAGDLGPALAHMGIFLGLLTLQPVWFNQFATDREGLSLLLTSPVSDRHIVQGKSLACGVLFAVFFLLCLTACLIVFPGGSPFLWLLAVANAASAYLLLAPLAAVLSAVLPRSSDLNRMGSKGNAHPLAGLVGTVATAVALAPGMLLGLLGRFVLDNDLLTFLLASAFAAVAFLLAVPLHRLAARVLEARRENLAMVAQGR